MLGYLQIRMSSYAFHKTIITHPPSQKKGEIFLNVTALLFPNYVKNFPN
jgi:hypothetical protein